MAISPELQAAIDLKQEIPPHRADSEEEERLTYEQIFAAEGTRDKDPESEDNKPLRQLYLETIQALGVTDEKRRLEQLKKIEGEVFQKLAWLQGQRALVLAGESALSAAQIDLFYEDTNYLYDQLIAPNLPATESVPHSTSQQELESINKILVRMHPPIEAIDLSKDFDQEKNRIEREVRRWVYRQLIGRMKDQAEGVIPTKPAGFWGAVSTGSGESAKPTVNLEDVLNAMPNKVMVNGVEKDLFLQIKGEMINFVNTVATLHDRAVHFYSYASPDEWHKKLEAANAHDSFGKEEMRRLIKEGNLADDSAYEAFRRSKQLFIKLAEDPNLARDYNMYPFGVVESIDIETSQVASQQKNQEWIIHELVAAGLSPESAELGYRMAVADNRQTTLEEFLDYIPTKSKNGNPIKKVRAIRSMTRMLRWSSWSRYSVGEKGTGRAPVSKVLGDKRPHLIEPAEKIWIVQVDVGESKPKPMSLYDVYRQGLWDKVLSDDNAFPGTPTTTLAQHYRYMGLKYYEIGADMTTKANTLLPDPAHLAKYESTAQGTFRRDIARAYAEYSKDKDISPKSRRILLDALYEGRYITVHVDDVVDYSISNIIKDAGDYAWDNTPISPDVFKELFSQVNPDDPDAYVDHRRIMEAVSLETLPLKEALNRPDLRQVLKIAYERRQQKKGETTPSFDSFVSGYDSDPQVSVGLKQLIKEQGLTKPKFVMWSVFTIMLMAELERYAIPEEERHHTDLLTPVKTRSGRPSMHWGLREALITYLLEIQAGMPDEYKEHHMSEENIRTMYKVLGIDECEAAETTDIQWMLVSPARHDTQVIPTLFPWLDRFADWIPFGTDIK